VKTKSYKLVVKVIVLLVVSFLFAVGWWNLWMYQGWFGSPKILHNIWPGVVDGERSYDVTLYEMWFIILLVVLPVGLFISHKRQK
jgi:hypothetical protein